MSQVIVLEKSVPEGIAVYCSHQFHSNTELEQNKRIQQTAKNGRRRVCAPHACKFQAWLPGNSTKGYNWRG